MKTLFSLITLALAIGGGSVADAGSVQNFSSRMTLPNGAHATIGFTVTDATAAVLIRAVGPGLQPLGVANAAGDPRLTIFAGPNVITSNDDWGKPTWQGSTANDLALWQFSWNYAQTWLSIDFARYGAFPLQRASKDAALTTTLTRGVYTVAVENAGSAGDVLVEVYIAAK